VSDRDGYALLAGAIALLLSYALTPVVRSLAFKWDIVAHPGGRRVHSRATPLLGGVAMFVGFIVAVTIVFFLDPTLRFDKSVYGILSGAFFLVIVGVLDDKYELPGWVQAVAIVLGGLILTAFGVYVVTIKLPFGGGISYPLGIFAIPATVVWVLMVTKAVDCMDGLDGLAAGISVIAAATFMVLALAAKPKSPEMASLMQMSAVLSAALLGGALGFLRFNYPPAKIFMGTVGAQFLGFTLAAISVTGAFKVATLVAVAAPVFILAVPLFDTGFVVIKRLVTGKKIHEADTSHLHHRLVKKGLSHRQVIWLIYAITLACSVVAYLLFGHAR
jgi:UDP-GlcNAc:undecaprenyl-phosphate/decaprenyl-phosphate GlcNAc-1-phosphate transferase